jgi:hypothetical protein
MHVMFVLLVGTDMGETLRLTRWNVVGNLRIM